jgi:plastocyanin
VHATLRGRGTRTIAAGALSLALLSAGTASAFAASPSPKASPKASPSAMGSITVKADKSTVKAGDKVTFTGRTKGLKVGTKLVLQHEKAGKWNALNGSTTVKNGSSYSLTAKLNTKGQEHLRIAAGTTYSPTVTVKVT